MLKVTELTFDKSYNSKYNCFTARYDGTFITGSNESGVFKIMNYRDVNPITRIKIEDYINNQYKKYKES